jgi:hypothetical protein
LESQVDVELGESAEEEAEHGDNDEDNLDDDVSNYVFVLEVLPSVLVGFEVKLNGFHKVKKGEDNHVKNGHVHVEQEQQEVLPIPEADAVVDPGAVVVHVEHATIAGRTVVAPLWFENIAHQTVPSSLVLRVSVVEALHHKSSLLPRKEAPAQGLLSSPGKRTRLRK